MENGPDIADWLSRARKAPRLSCLLGEFSALASGRKGVPDFPVTLDPGLLAHDQAALDFAEVRARYAGAFNQHFVASLPYALEEQCRFGSAIYEFGRFVSSSQGRPYNVYTLGDGPGVLARSLSDISSGLICTLTCSPNIENQLAFNADRPNGSAHFFHGPFFEVTNNTLHERGIDGFKNGFDLILEDTTFQMYGRERVEPIYLALKNLRADGIFVVLEKFSMDDQEEFHRREVQKDESFKSRFFCQEKIEEKKLTIVKSMDQQLVTLGDMKNALDRYFSYSVVVWNSGNFYTVVSSNNKENITRFVRCLIPPAIPVDFCYIDLPYVLIGNQEFMASFRRPISHRS